MIKNLNEQEKKALITLCKDKKNLNTKLSWNDIGKMYGCTGEQVRCWYNHKRYKEGDIKGMYEPGKESILIMSDLHIPEHDEERILEACRKNKNVAMLILGGDIIDCAGVSAWTSEGITLLDQELIEAHKMMKKIKEIMSPNCKIILVKGNHEHRVNRTFATNAKQLGSAIVETEILYKLANGFTVHNRNENIRIQYPGLENVFYCENRTFIYGDLLINHPSSFSKIPLNVAKNMYENTFKVKYPQCKVFLLGHTHQLGLCYRDDGVVLGETGCMSFKHDYANDDTRPYGPAQTGFFTLDMINKKVDINSIKSWYLGACREKYRKWTLNV